MENLVKPELIAEWAGKRVLVTGHTGFKGAWLCLMLHQLGAQVHGYALPQENADAIFNAAHVSDVLKTQTIADICERKQLSKAIRDAQPDVLIHMAAQSLVHESYSDPMGTFMTNVMGTAHVFEAVRISGCTPTIVNVTTDKCYHNREWIWSYRENEPMGGKDPYSASKGCAELLTAAWKHSFLQNEGIAVATARAGNVIGGGDQAENRLIPDLARAVEHNVAPIIRSPDALRPWQHALEPLCGYLQLATALSKDTSLGDEGWNFGPESSDTRNVGWVVDAFLSNSESVLKPEIQKHSLSEAKILKLDSTKAMTRLGWSPVWSTQEAIQETAYWYMAQRHGKNMRAVTELQIANYLGRL